MTKHWLIGGLLALACAAGAAGPEEDAFLKPVGQPPVAKAQRRQGGESLPPLPLPALERDALAAYIEASITAADPAALASKGAAALKGETK